MTREKLIQLGRDFADEVGSIRRLVKPTDEDYAAIGRCVLDAAGEMEPDDIFPDERLNQEARSRGYYHEEPPDRRLAVG